MPLLEREFELNAPIEAVWKLLNDPIELGKCVPGCQDVSAVSPTECRWKVKFALGVISRLIDAKARVVEAEAPSKLVIKIESTDGQLKAQLGIKLANLSASSTRLRLGANVDARGPFQLIVDQIVKTQLDKLLREFSECVSHKLPAQA